MSETPVVTPDPTPEAPAAAAPPEAAPVTPPAKRSLEDLLGGLDEDARGVILGEVSKARGEAKNLRDRLKDAEPKLAEYARLEEASKTETERAQEAAAAAQSRVQALLTRAVEAEVKALAATLFADPTDAAAFIGDLTKFTNDDGEIDTAAIKSDLDDLLARKPHLGKAPGGRPPAPNPAQGSSANGSPMPTQLTRGDIERLAREGRHDEIDKAREEGRLNVVLGIKTT